MISGAAARLAIGAHNNNDAGKNNFDRHLDTAQMQPFPYYKLPPELQKMVAREIAFIDKKTYLSFAVALKDKSKSYSKYRFSFSPELMQKEDNLFSGLTNKIVTARRYSQATIKEGYGFQLIEGAQKRLSNLENILSYIRMYRDTPVHSKDRDHRDAVYERIVSKAEHRHFESGSQSITRRKDAIQSMRLSWIDHAFERDSWLLTLNEDDYMKAQDAFNLENEKLINLVRDQDSWVNRLSDDEYDTLIEDMGSGNQKQNDLLLNQRSWLTLADDDLYNRVVNAVALGNDKLSDAILVEDSWLHDLDDDQFSRIKAIISEEKEELDEGALEILLDRILIEYNELLRMSEESFNRVLSAAVFDNGEIIEQLLQPESWLLTADQWAYERVVAAYSTDNSQFINLALDPKSWIFRLDETAFERTVQALEVHDDSLANEVLDPHSAIQGMNDQEFNHYLDEADMVQALRLF